MRKVIQNTSIIVVQFDYTQEWQGMNLRAKAFMLNPVPTRMAETPWTFGRSECKTVKALLGL